MYEKVFNRDETETFIKRINNDETVSYIPMDEANADYQQYLAWLEEQNTTGN